MDLETLNFLCLLYTPVPTSPVRIQALPLIADPYLIVKFGVKYRQNFEIFGSNCPIQGRCKFQWFLTEYSSYGIWNFQNVFLHDRALHTWVMRVIPGHHLGVTDGLGNLKCLVRTLPTCAYQLCKNEGLTFNSRSILNCQIWVQYRENFRNLRVKLPYSRGGACLNDFSQSIVATGFETFRIYSYMIEPSGLLIKRDGRMRVILDGTSNLKFI